MSQAITHDIQRLRVTNQRTGEQSRSPPPRLTPSHHAHCVGQNRAPSVDRGDSNRNTKGRCLDDLIVAQVDRNVVDVATIPVPENQIAGLSLAHRHASAFRVLCLRPVGQVDPLRTVRHGDQTGAVIAGAFARPHVSCAELALRPSDGTCSGIRITAATATRRRSVIVIVIAGCGGRSDVRLRQLPAGAQPLLQQPGVQLQRLPPDAALQARPRAD